MRGGVKKESVEGWNEILGKGGGRRMWMDEWGWIE